ncbi:Uncharacterized protein Rs2_35325 [Raphanus sativus]|nr:Uncharacterized protein Rs2_35325 [Raphanus sativus]
MAKSKGSANIGNGAITPTQIAFIVDRYLHDNRFSKTRSLFRSGASSLLSNSPVPDSYTTVQLVFPADGVAPKATVGPAPATFLLFFSFLILLGFSCLSFPTSHLLMVDGRFSLRRYTLTMRVSGRLSVSASYGISVLDGGSGWIPVSYCDLGVCAALLQAETSTFRGVTPVKEAID